MCCFTIRPSRNSKKTANLARNSCPATNGPAATRTVPVQMSSIATQLPLASARTISKCSALSRAFATRPRLFHGFMSRVAPFGSSRFGHSSWIKSAAKNASRSSGSAPEDTPKMYVCAIVDLFVCRFRRFLVDVDSHRPSPGGGPPGITDRPRSGIAGNRVQTSLGASRRSSSSGWPMRLVRESSSRYDDCTPTRDCVR